jgi:hypothetical protein
MLLNLFYVGYVVLLDVGTSRAESFFYIYKNDTLVL